MIWGRGDFLFLFLSDMLTTYLVKDESLNAYVYLLKYWRTTNMLYQKSIENAFKMKKGRVIF